MSEKKIIAENQADGLVTNEIATDEECIGQTAWLRLFGLREFHSPLASVAQQSLKRLKILRHADDENFSNPRQHQ